MYLYENEQPAGFIASKSMFTKLPFINGENDNLRGYLLSAELENTIIVDYEKDCFIRISKIIDE